MSITTVIDPNSFEPVFHVNMDIKLPVTALNEAPKSLIARDELVKMLGEEVLDQILEAKLRGDFDPVLPKLHSLFQR